MYLKELMDLDLLQEMIEQGYVTAREHDSLPLVILNYTAKAQYEWVWNDVTLKARGLIFNKMTHEIIARPFEKFFNWDQGKFYPPAGPVIRMEKMDGSLGVLYQHKTNVPRGVQVEYGIATRGSFHSDQAHWATEFFGDNFSEFFPLSGKTYLFEIIYPENRIVVDYGEYKGLVLIDVIDNETGKSDLQEFDDCVWPDKVKRVPLPGFDSGQVNDIGSGEEGFVYLWPERNVRTKMKSAEYVELHKLVSHLNEKTIWQALMDGKTLDQIKAGVPDEFYGFIDTTYHAIMDQVAAILHETNTAMWNLHEQFLEYSHAREVPRKDFAMAVKDHPMKKYLFLMLDGKPLYPVALAAAKPKKTTDLTRGE